MSISICFRACGTCSTTAWCLTMPPRSPHSFTTRGQNYRKRRFETTFRSAHPARHWHSVYPPRNVWDWKPNSALLFFHPEPFGCCRVHDDTTELCKEVLAERAAGVFLADGGAKRPRKASLKNVLFFFPCQKITPFHLHYQFIHIISITCKSHVILFSDTFMNCWTHFRSGSASAILTLATLSVSLNTWTWIIGGKNWGAVYKSAKWATI